MGAIGAIASILGILVCIASVVVRIQGQAYIYGLEVLSFLNVGIALMVFGCLAKLHDLSKK